LKIPKIGKFRFSNTIKIKIDKDVCDLILKKYKYISKKDLGLFISKMLSKQENLDLAIHDFVSKKYSLEKITDFLKKSDKKNISFQEIRKVFNISKRMFYPRLRIIKKYFMERPDFNWTIKRGKFMRYD